VPSTAASEPPESEGDGVDDGFFGSSNASPENEGDERSAPPADEEAPTASPKKDAPVENAKDQPMPAVEPSPTPAESSDVAESEVVPETSPVVAPEPAADVEKESELEQRPALEKDQ